ncbi:hypothetical protein FACS189449_03790 [Alphaproteobacteria bacterium]|nr:hypothetical protein FACS189449_03790 [Alphaproteobacteria bacterium]
MPGSFLEVAGKRYCLSPIPPDGNCALSVLGITRRDLVKFLQAILKSDDPRLEAARTYISKRLLQEIQFLFEARGGCSVSQYRWWNELPKGTNDLDKILLYLNFFVEPITPDFTAMFEGVDPNFLDLGYALGEIMALALQKNLHIIWIPFDGDGRDLPQRALLISAIYGRPDELERNANNLLADGAAPQAILEALDLSDAAKAMALAQQILPLNVRLNSTLEDDNVVLLHRHGNHYDRGILAPDKAPVQPTKK